MAKSSSKKKSKATKGSKKNEKEELKQQQKKRLITMEELDAISSSDEDGEGQVLPPENQWNSMAKNLRKAIEDGAFDKLVDGSKNDGDDDDGDEFEEATIDSSGNSEGGGDEDEEESDDNSENSKVENEDGSESGSENDDEEEESRDSSSDDKNGDQAKQQTSKQSKKTKDDDSSEEEGTDDDEEEEMEDEETQKKVQQMKQPPKEKTIKEKNTMSSKALEMVTVELEAVTATMPWAETLEIIPETPLPFGAGALQGNSAGDEGDDDEENSPLDIHDDLKREAAFYNTALDAVMEARKKCREIGIPFSRPDDFFAEMVKTDGTCVRWECVCVDWFLL